MIVNDLDQLDLCLGCGRHTFDVTAGECRVCPHQDGPPVVGVVILLAAVMVAIVAGIALLAGTP